jgi:hypothetical protein
VGEAFDQRRSDPGLTPNRDIPRSECGTPACKQSRKERKKVEMLFAHKERISKLDRLRLGGISGVRDIG